MSWDIALKVGELLGPMVTAISVAWLTAKPWRNALERRLDVLERKEQHAAKLLAALEASRISSVTNALGHLDGLKAQCSEAVRADGAQMRHGTSLDELLYGIRSQAGQLLSNYRRTLSSDDEFERSLVGLDAAVQEVAVQEDLDGKYLDLNDVFAHIGNCTEQARQLKKRLVEEIRSQAQG